MNIKEGISKYDFEGKMAHIYEKFNQKEIINEVLNILENNSSENNLNIELFNTAMTFVTDTIIFSDLSDVERKAFVKTLFEMGYFEKIEKYLYNEYLNIKHITIHSIGKISIKDNVKYLEKAFEKYYAINPIICSKLLLEITWLDNDKYAHYYSLLENDTDTINSMAFSLFLNAEENISYEIMVFNLHSIFKLKDWTREDYVKSIKYFKNRNKICTDYEKIYSEIFLLK